MIWLQRKTGTLKQTGKLEKASAQSNNSLKTEQRTKEQSMNTEKQIGNDRAFNQMTSGKNIVWRMKKRGAIVWWMMRSLVVSDTRHIQSCVVGLTIFDQILDFYSQ